jgi:hypothetical protein
MVSTLEAFEVRILAYVLRTGFTSAGIAQLVEHTLGKGEVAGSIPVPS